MNIRTLVITCFLLISAISARAQWVQTNSPQNDILTFGGDITCLASIGNDLFAGTSSSGLILSTDNGTSWTLVSLSQFISNELSVNALFVSGGNILTIAGGALFFSTDTGESWKEFSLPHPNFSSISMIAMSGSNLIAGSINDSTYLSTDTGKTWASLDTLFDVSCFAEMGGNLYAGTNDGGMFLTGVYVSTNNGVNWNLTDTGERSGKRFVLALGANGGNLFESTLSGMFLSSDQGASWIAIDSGMPDSLTYASRVDAFAFSGQNIYVGTEGSGVYLSTNNGTIWSASPDSGLTNSYISALVINNGNLYVGTGNGVYLSTDNGANWAVHNSLTLINSVINSLDTIGGKLFACTQGGLFVTTDSGANWMPDTTGIGTASVTELAANDGNLFAATDGSGIFRSTDNGVSWTPADSGLFYVYLGDTTREMNVNSLTQANGILYAGTQATLFVSKDNGVSWSNPGFATQWMAESDFAVIGTTIVAGNSSNMFYSPDQGEDWYVEQDLPPYTTINAINALVLMGGHVYAGTNLSGVWISDNGTDWVQANDSGLTDPDVITLLVNGSTLFAATNSGRIFYSTDDAAIWHPVDSGLQPNLPITSLAIKDSILYAGTTDSGIWRHSLAKAVPAPSGIVVAETQASTGISIYPNPAMSSITITSSVGPISILDPLGRCYDVRQTGTTLDISALPSGVYFVSDGHSRVKFVKE